MLYSVSNFFMTAVNHRSLQRITKVAAGSLYTVTSTWIVVAADWALEAFSSSLEFTGKTTLVALVDWGVGTKVAYLVVSPVPNGFKSCWVLLQVRVLAVVDETTSSVFWIIHFETQLFKWSWVLSNIVVE